MIGTNVGADEVISLNSMPAPYSWYPRELPPVGVALRTRTDTNGHFVFISPPGMMEVAHAPQIREEAPELIDRTQTRRLNLEPGETARVELGGRGRTVFGRVELAGVKGQVAWKQPLSWVETFPDAAAPSGAGLTNFLTKLIALRLTNASSATQQPAVVAYEAERRKVADATREYYSTEQGMAALMSGRRFAIQWGENGMFQIVDLPLGKYVAHWVIATEPEAGNEASPRVRLPSVFGETVIEVPDGNAPLDLGTIRLKR
jgi:hypothetical protein